jgi:hypothetical protein
MSSKATDKRLRSRISYALVFTALCGLLVAATALAGLPAQGKRPPRPASVIGQTNKTPAPLCPQKPSEHYIDRHSSAPVKRFCQAVGSVTGFGLKTDGRRHAFRATRNGRIVAWAVSVANTNGFEEKAFGSLDFFGTKRFGAHPTAQLSILKKKDGPRYKLLRRSPVVDLNSAQGHKEYFTLKQPLRIKKGQIVGITMPTWAAILASNKKIATSNSWSASRNPKKCGGTTDQQRRHNAVTARPQTKIHSVRKFGCTYSGRLLYWAYYVPGLH